MSRSASPASPTAPRPSRRIVGFLIFDTVYTTIAGQKQFLVAGKLVSMGVLSGILMGMTAALLYQRFHRVKLPDYLAFFGGRRFVPIITGAGRHPARRDLRPDLAGHRRGFNSMGNWIVAHQTVGAGVYGVVNRLLLPFGLHHIPNSLLWFQFGDLQRQDRRPEPVLRRATRTPAAS